MVSITKVDSGPGYRIVLSPNCSISWRELVLFYLATCLIALAVGLFFTLQGLWLVLPFSGLEMLALGAGLLPSMRSIPGSKKACSGSTRAGSSKRHGYALSMNFLMTAGRGAGSLSACMENRSK
jgi:hypothetical protein